MKIKTHIALFALLASSLLLPINARAKTPSSEDTLDVHATLARANKLLEYNGISRAATLYERVLKHHPTSYPEVAFVLGQIYEHKQSPEKAVLFYHMSIATGISPEAEQDAQDAIQRLQPKGWRRLKVILPQDTSGYVSLNNLYVLSTDPSTPLEILVPPDQYTLSVKLHDHHPEEMEIDLTEESGVTLYPNPEPFMFFGFLDLSVTNYDKAHISITQEVSKSPQGRMNELFFQGKVPKDFKLPTGTYFIEVTDPDHDRWIRRIHVERDLEVEVIVRLTKALPPEIRYDDIRHQEMKYILQRDAHKAIFAASQKAQDNSEQVATGKITRDQALGIKHQRIIAKY